jgi:hypothetical protein
MYISYTKMTCRLVIVWAAWTRLEEYLPRKLFSSMTTSTLPASLSCTSLTGRAHQRVTNSLAPMPFLLSFRALVTTLSFVWTASCSPDPFSTRIQAFSLLYACVSKRVALVAGRQCTIKQTRPAREVVPGTSIIRLSHSGNHRGEGGGGYLEYVKVTNVTRRRSMVRYIVTEHDNLFVSQVLR